MANISSPGVINSSDDRSKNIRHPLWHLLTHAGVMAWVVLGVSLFITGWIVQELRARDLRYEQQQFTIQVQDVIASINQRMKAQEQILIGAAALFDASASVDRNEWHAYIERLNLSHYYPGIQAVAFTQFFHKKDLVKHTQAIQAEGFPQYHVYPVGEREHYTAITYIEPFVGRNRAAFGFDMFAESVRRRTMTAAVEENDTRISSKVTLVQETQGDIQAGLLMYIPIYKFGLPLLHSQQRWAALQGFVYSAYRVDDLMYGIIGQQNLNIRFNIYDSEAHDEEHLLYRSHPAENIAPAEPLIKNMALDLYGQRWTIRFSKMPEKSSIGLFRLDVLVVVSGTFISVLLFLLVSFLVDEQRRAQALADRMTANLRRKVEELRLNDERFRLALDSSAMGTWNWFLAENTICWDNYIYTLFGLPENAKLDTYESFLALVHPDDRARIFQEVANTMENNAPYDTEYRVLWADGTTHHIASRAKLLLDDQQKPLLMTGTCWDITEKIHAERIKEEFVSTVSHELRTPLTSIAGVLGLLNDGALDLASDKAQQLLVIAYRNSQRLKVLIDDLLDIDKLSNGKMEFNLQPLAVAPLLQRALDENKHYAEQYHVEYHFHSELASAFANLDEQKFLQVMSNLLSNAAKFSTPHSIVLVQLLAVSEQHLRIAVIDKGIGIPKSEFVHIFEKFYQVDASDTRKKGGTGLGLAIAKLMVEKMHGSIGFTSEENLGSTFYIDFPIFPSA